MNYTDFLKDMPGTVTMLGGWVTGAFSFFLAWRAYRAKQIKTKKDLLEEYKKMYIKQSLEIIHLLESESEKRRLLIEMELFCPECYKAVTEKLGYEKSNQ